VVQLRYYLEARSILAECHYVPHTVQCRGLLSNMYQLLLPTATAPCMSVVWGVSYVIQ